MTGAGVTAYGDQYLAAVGFLRRAWPYNRDLAADEPVSGAVLRALRGPQTEPGGEAERPWDDKRNGVGSLLIPSEGGCLDLNVGLTEPGDLEAFLRGQLWAGGATFCDLCRQPIPTGDGGWLPVAAPPSLIVLGVCDVDTILLTTDHPHLTWIKGAR